jgi:hypothetical protein
LLINNSSFVDRDMFARFCGFGPGHKSTRHVTKVFRDEINEAFGLGKDDTPEDDTLEVQPREHDEHGDEEIFEGESDKENSEDSEVDFFEEDIEDELGYAPL